MNDDDLALRNLTYARFAELGRAPTAAEIATAAGRDRAEVIARWERLHAQHALVLDPVTSEIRMANPFSGSPPATASRLPDGGGTAIVPGMHSGSAPPCTRTGGSRHRARTAVQSCRLRWPISVLMTKACSSIVSSRRPGGGMTLSSLEAR